MSNRFPEEPYPVITDWPGVVGHNTLGIHRCFHYSLTLNEVRHKADVAGDNATNSNVGGLVVLDILGIAGIFASPPVGLLLWAGSVWMQMADYDRRATQKNLFLTWERIATEMVRRNCRRVTISQVLRLDYSEAAHEPIWIPEGAPRVPLAKYYLKN